MYSFKNTTNLNCESILFERFGKNDTITIGKLESKILSKDVPPYDDGSFGGYDSIKILFEDSKFLIYKQLRSYININKNPFCPYSNHMCIGNNCTFEIDDDEYKKAK